MEEELSTPLPLLPLGREEVNASHDENLNAQQPLRHVPSQIGPFTTPGVVDDTQTIIQWQAAELLSVINIDTLIHKVPRHASSYQEIERVPIIKSYMNMLLLLQEKASEKQWITRIPYLQEDRRFLIDQVEPLLRAGNRFKTFRVPRLYHYGLAKDDMNDLGIDYMLLDFMDGRQMPMWTETFPCRQQKVKILEQIAGAYMEMFSKPVNYEDRLVLNNANCREAMQADYEAFDLPPTNTASLYLHDLADQAICGKVDRLLADDAVILAARLKTSMYDRYRDLLTLLLMRASISTMVIGSYNDSAFFITHPDLHNRNIIIQGMPIPDPEEIHYTARHKEPEPENCMDTVTEGIEAGDIKVVGIVDWDCAHPLPLQLAAIYPKFLETLPGAEFPDLSDNYIAPDLEPEKKLFVDLLAEQEIKATGARVVADLILDSSWERDFFTVALRRGDVRGRWLNWWREQRTETQSTSQMAGAALEGLIGFFRRDKNFETVRAAYGWPLVARVLVDLQAMEEAFVEESWQNFGRAQVASHALKDVL